MKLHLLYARLSSSFYLAGLLLVLIVVSSVVSAVLFPSIGRYIENAGLSKILVLSLPYIGPPLIALSILFGLLSRCPNCRAKYVEFKWFTPPVSLPSELGNGMEQVYSAINVARGKGHRCTKCKFEWR